MANITNLKRKAQKLVQQGQYPEAIELYIDIVGNNDSDPYDFVVLGDLLLRDDQTEIAVERYQEAVDAYIHGGLHRNAIALCKRIRRLTPSRIGVQRQLGELYLKEGLNTESALHYLEYLESAKDEEDFTDQADQVCRTLLSFRLPSFDLVPRVVEIAESVDRTEDLAPLVFQQFQWAQQEGHAKVAGKLLEAAQGLDPDIERNFQQEEAGPTGEIEQTTLKAPRRDSMDIDMDDPSAVNLEMPSAKTESNLADAAGEDDPSSVTLESPAKDSSGRDESGVFDLDEAMHTGAGDSSARLDAPLELDDDEPENPEDLRHRADDLLERGEQLLAQREYMKTAHAYMGQEDWHHAETVLKIVSKLDPNHVDALQTLVDVAGRQGDDQKQIQAACDLGDVYVAREMYAEALEQFKGVLKIDPEHAKAQTRVARLEDLSQQAAEEDATDPTVTVRDEAGQPTQTENDLAAILDEFRSSIVEAIPDDDAQSHYDMGMAYREMQLFDEAIQEFQISMTDEAIRPRALEATADCHISKEEYVEAHDLLEEVLAYAEDQEVQARIRLAMGRCFMGYGQVDDARENLHKALELNEDLVEAAELLQELELKQSGE